MSQTRDRTSTAQGRIVIAGTGRAGTTFLVQLFTALGFGTGFSPKDLFKKVDKISHAGLEKPLVDEANPYVIKSPWFAEHLAEALQNKRLDIHAALLPVRDLFSAAESRRRVYREALSRGLKPLRPGSIGHTKNQQDLEVVLLRRFYNTIFPLIRYEVPIYLIEFPRLVVDANYLFKTLLNLMSEHGVSYSEFLLAHARVVRPELVSDFSTVAASVDAAVPPKTPRNFFRGMLAHRTLAENLSVSKK